MKGRTMAHGDRTSMGGGDYRFRTTHWTEILSARTRDQANRRKAVGAVLARYWRPMYCFLRRKGYDNEQAKDIVQGFCQDIALGHGLIQRADPERGRFRTFLLTSLRNYVSNIHRAGAARKRSPQKTVLSLDAADTMNLVEISHDATPEETFHYAWAAQLLDDVLATVEAECCRDGKLIHWQVFYERVVQPLMENAEPPSFLSLCRKYRISDESKASNMTVTVKRRFRVELTRQVRQAVGSDADVVQEIKDLMDILSHSGARL